MADSLVLKGFKEVKKHTGTEMKLQCPKRGNEFPIKKWWAVNAGSVQYASCALFKVTVDGNSVLLAIDASSLSTIRIDHDGNFNFNFYICTGVARAALFTEDRQLIEHYVFPKISGGKIMTVIPPIAASRPSSKSIGVVNVSGPSSGKEGDVCTFTATNDGNAPELSYQWSLTGNATFSGKTTNKTAKVVLGSASVGVTCTISSADKSVSDDPASGYRVVSVEIKEESD